MLELKTLDAARHSTLACLVWSRAEHQCAIRVSPRDTWLVLPRTLSAILRLRLKHRYENGSAPPTLSYRDLIQLARHEKENAIARLLTIQLSKAKPPTHSHAPTDWRPPIKLTKTMLPAYSTGYDDRADSRRRGQRRGGRHDQITTIFIQD